MLKLVLIAAIVSLNSPAVAQSFRDGSMSVDQTEVVVTVTAVDRTNRTVTILGPKGSVETLDVPPASQNLDKVNPGDRFKLKYIEAVAIGFSKGGTPEQSETKDIKLSPKGGTPGGMIVRTLKRSVLIDAVDYKSRYIAVREASGQTLALKVAQNVPIEELSAGDRVSIVHTQAVVAEMLQQSGESASP